MELQWHETEPGTYEARVGAWLFEVGRNDEAKPWRVWVGLMPESNDATSAVFYRRDVAGSLEDAKRVAIELAKEKAAPFVDAASAEEREACAKVADQLGRPGIAVAIRARSKPDARADESKDATR